jgi:tetratricopeptide (TPR) repeat protein
MDHSPQLAAQWELLEQGEYAKAFQQTMALSDGLSGPHRRDAERLLGWVCYRQQQYAQASLWFKKACSGSDWADDWLNLAISTARQGQWTLSDQALEQVRLCQQAARYAQEPGLYLQLLAYARTLSDVGEPARVQVLLDELVSAYRRVGSADTTVLYVLRLPFLSSFLTLAVTHFRRQDNEDEGKVWLLALGAALDEEGQRRVAKAVEELGK